MATTNDYQSRIDKAVQLMKQQLALEQTPSLDELSQAACLSKFHFHRIYRLVTGESCQQTITRLKLAKATYALEDNNQSITEIAMQAGFSSSQALAKALKRETSETATNLRNEPDRLSQTLAFLSKPDPNNSKTGLFSIELTSLDPFEFIAIPTEGSYPELNDVYRELFMNVGDPTFVKAILGVPECNAGLLSGDGAVFDCGLLLNSSLENYSDRIEYKDFAGGDFVRVRHNGNFAGLDETLDKTYSAILIQEGIVFTDQPCLFHYLDDPEEVVEDQLRTDVYIPINSIS